MRAITSDFCSDTHRRQIFLHLNPPPAPHPAPTPLPLRPHSAPPQLKYSSEVRPLLSENFSTEKITQRSQNISDFINVKKYERKCVENNFYSVKLPPASTTAWILDRNYLQALATVSLSWLPITSMTFWTRESEVLWESCYMQLSDAPHKTDQRVTVWPAEMGTNSLFRYFVTIINYR